MQHFNYLKQFMIKLFRNNLYFKNITSKFTDSVIMCNSCKIEPEDIIHFFKCKIHNEFIQKLFKSLIYLELLENTPKNGPFFHNTSLPLNQPTNLIYISIIKLCTTYATQKQSLQVLLLKPMYPNLLRQPHKCILVILIGSHVVILLICCKYPFNYCKLQAAPAYNCR